MPEWLNGAVSKTVVEATPSRVRIPASPPVGNSNLKIDAIKTGTGFAYMCDVFNNFLVEM